MSNEKEIINLLMYYDDLYFNEGESQISDTEYDLLRSKAEKLFPNNKYFKKSGIKVKYEEIKLPYILGGLNKVTPETLLDWLKNKPGNDLIISEKLDGVSIICIWENGKVVFAATKGDGYNGQNLINKAVHFVPEIPVKERVSLRGEILLLHDDFKKLGFKNRRNGVGGLIRRDKIEPEKLKYLKSLFYEVLEAPGEFKTEEERMKYISETLKLDTPNYFSVNSNYNNLPSNLTSVIEIFKREKAGIYDIDGLVVTINNSQRENLEYPKDKVKFKVNELAKKVEVLYIEWNVSRTGCIKPVILINPTEINGALVSRVNGFNADFIVYNGIGKNSIVGVVRSGDVTPYITEIYSKVEIDYPKKCPCCGNELIKSSVELICENQECYNQKIKKVSHFFTTMGVEGFSERTMDNIGIDSIPGIYSLTKEYLENLPGFGEKKAEKMINEIRKTLYTKPEKLLASFGMPLIGKTLSKKICSKFTIDELFEIKDCNKLGLGDITSNSLINNIENYKELYDYLKSIGLTFIKEDSNMKTLKDMRFTLTRTGPIKRPEIQKMIEDLGGEVKGINKESSYLVTDDINSVSGKTRNAKKFGIPIITYDQLFKEFLN